LGLNKHSFTHTNEQRRYGVNDAAVFLTRITRMQVHRLRVWHSN